MSYNISDLLCYLRREGTLSGADDHTTYDLIYKADNAFILRFVSFTKLHDLWLYVYRSSRQYYKLCAFVDSFHSHYILHAHFRNYRSTGDYIKNLI